ncbi:hypothetical protein QMK19_34540 [Streptomyces sp. H10-C2]|uniref:hypothetical protein n=1 Tax=unclassified Streptomyces TaxID=2593676 RepID=UPI0024BBD54C|nr:MULTISPECIES: hypothetical protein [unclassified Streptomyces]MDJ0346697.1 hypothetical protein [Streptomyces sp. PH10-H1]MDJ0374605.1 hypothetical protein [Streptomyces sp. H10-C2]
MLLGRLDATGRLRYVGRSTPLGVRARQDLAEQLVAASPQHPWAGATFSAAWGAKSALATTLVRPQTVAEFAGDTAVDAGRWRHLVRFLRVRADMSPDDVQAFGES